MSSLMQDSKEVNILFKIISFMGKSLQYMQLQRDKAIIVLRHLWQKVKLLYTQKRINHNLVNCDKIPCSFLSLAALKITRTIHRPFLTVVTLREKIDAVNAKLIYTEFNSLGIF